MMRIAMATGGSGGHVFPALLVAEELRRRNHEVYFVASGGKILDKITSSGFNLLALEAKGMAMGSLAGLAGSVRAMVRASCKARGFLKTFRPGVVSGFGGYGAFPGVFAAATLRLPVLIHEQNAVPGKANRVLALTAQKIAVSFEGTFQYFPKQKTVYTGCPCHNRIPSQTKEEILLKWGLSPQHKTVLAVGGSQGSRKINQEFIKAIPRIHETLPCQVIHVSGKDDVESLKCKYSELGIKACVYEFLDDIESAYRACDVVVSRCGALAVSEIAAFGIPAVFIPYPLAGGHQRENARTLAGMGPCEILEEVDLSTEKLVENILKLLNGPAGQKAFTVRSEISGHEAQRLADEILSLKDREA